MRGVMRSLAVTIAERERAGIPLVEALKAALTDPAREYSERAAAGQLLRVDGDPRAVDALLELFFAQNGKDELYETALTFERLNDRRVLPELMDALLNDRGARDARFERCALWKVSDEAGGRRASDSIELCRER